MKQITEEDIKKINAEALLYVFKKYTPHHEVNRDTLYELKRSFLISEKRWTNFFIDSQKKEKRLRNKIEKLKSQLK